MSNRILVIDGHPDPDRKRFCNALAEAYLDGARSTGKEARLLTVAEADFPLLRTAVDFAAAPDAPAVLRARDDLMWCDHLVLIFPLWLGDAPAFLRAFIEQVARGAFVAETSGKGIRQNLKGRSARLIVTMGMPALIYRLMFHAHGLRAIMQGVLGFGGVAPVRSTLFGAVEAATGKTAAHRLQAVSALGRAGL